MKKQVPQVKQMILTTLLFLLITFFMWNDVYAQCGNANSFTPTVSATMVCSGTNVSVNATGLPVKKWLYRDNNTGAWLVNNTTSTVFTDYPNTSVPMTRTYRAVVGTSTCPTDTTLGVSVNVTPLTYGTNNNFLISASASSICSGLSVNLNLLTVSGTVQNWIYRNNNTGSWIYFASSQESVSDYNTTVTTATIRSYRALIKLPNTCEIDSSATINVTINPNTYGNNNAVRPNVTLPAVCGGTSVSLSVEWDKSLVLNWLYRDNSSGSWNAFGSSSSTPTDNNTNVTLSTTREYRVLLKYANSCNIDTSDVVSITINPSVKRVLNSITPTYTGTNPICTGNYIYPQLGSGYSSSNVLNWLYRDSSNGNWVSAGSNTLNPSIYVNTNITKNITREIRVVINNSALTCSIDTSAPVFVSIRAQSKGNTTAYMPLISNANICSGVALQVYMNTSNVSVYNWVYRNNNTGNWISAGSGTPYYDNNTTVTTNTTRSYRALISSSMNCSIDTTNEVSTFIKMPAIGGTVNITPTMGASGYCVGNTPNGNITVNSQQGISKWIYRDNNTGAWLDLSGQSGTYFYDYYTSSLTVPTTRSYRGLVRNNETCTIDTSNEVSTLISPPQRGNLNSVLPAAAAPFVCSGSYLQLTVTIPSGYSVYYWLYRDTTFGNWNTMSGSGSATDYNTTVSYTRTRTYRVLFQNSANCRFDTSAAITVNLMPKGNGNSSILPITNNPLICGGSSSINVQVSIPSGSSVTKWVYRDNSTGAWAQVPNSSSSTSYTDQQSNTGVLIPTVREYRAIINNNNTCSNDTTSAVSSSINPLSGGASIAVTPTASATSTVCNSSSPYVYINYSGNVQKWIYKDNSGPWIDNNTTSTYLYENNLRVSVPTSRQYKAIVYRTGTCLVDTTQNVTLNINPYTNGNVTNPVPATTTPSICSGGSGLMNITMYAGQSIQKWIYRDNISSPWLDFTSSTSSSSLNDYNTIITSNTTRSYRAIIKQSGCSFDTTSSVSMSINVPVYGYQLSATPASSTPILCSGSTANINLTGTYSGGVKKWIYRDNGGVWYDVPSSGNTSIAHTNTNVSSATTRSYRAIISSNTCSIDSSAIYNITINPVGAGYNSTMPTANATSYCASNTSPLNLSVSLGSGFTVKKWIQRDNSGAWTDFGYTTTSTNAYDYNTAVTSSVIRSYRVLLNNTNTCSVDSSAVVMVSLNANLRGNLTSVTPTTTNSRLNFCYGMPVNINVSVPSGYSIQKWIYSNNNGEWKNFESSTTSSSVTDNNTYVGATTTRSYRAIMTNSATCSTDSTATLNVVLNYRNVSTNNASTIPTTSTPSVCSGNYAYTSITPVGANTVYKWIYSNSGVTGPWYDVLNSYSSNSLSHNNTVVQTSTARLYRAILTDTSTCDYDSSATVTVTINPLGYGNDTNITLTTTDTVCIGTTVTISASVPGGSTVVKWLYRDNGTGIWVDTKTSGSTYYDYSTNLPGLGNRQYRVIELKNSNCSNDTSKIKTVFFRSKTYGNNTSTQAYAGTNGVVDTICSGNSVNLQASATVDGWMYKDGNGPWTIIASSSTTSYTHTNTTVTATTWRYYRALFNPGSCRADSSIVDSVLLRTLGNGNNNAIAPTTSTSTVCSGSSPYLSVSVPSGSTIQKWISRDNNTGSWLDFYTGSTSGLNDNNTNVTSSTTRSYRVVYFKSCSYDTTAALTITISPRSNGTNASLTPTASSTTVCAGTPVSNISVNAGSGNTIMKWIYRDNSSGSWIDLVNGNTNNINDYNTYVGSVINRSYKAIIINNTTCSNDTTAALNVTINPVVVGSISTTIPTASPSNSICSGTALTINVNPGSGNSVVRWTYNTNGGTWYDWGYNTSTSISDYNTYVSSSTTKGYRALIYQVASCRIDTSLALTVTVNPRTYGNDNTITPTAGSSTVCYGSSNTISVTPGSGNTVNKWISRDNNTGAWYDISGSSTSFTDYSYVSTVTTRSYRAIITKGSTCTNDTSAALNVTLSPLVYGNDNAIAVTSTASVCTGASIAVSVTPGSNSVTGWLYRDNYTGSWNVLSYTSSTSITDYVNTSGSIINRTYRSLIRKTGTCNVDTSNVDTTVINPRIWGNDNTITPTAGPASICVGTNISLNVTPGGSNTVLKWIYSTNGGAWVDFYNGNATSLTDYYTNVSSSTTRTYRVIITKGSSCTNDTSAAVTVTINPRNNGNDNSILPNSTSSIYCSGSYVTVNVTPGSGNSISKWIYRDNNTGAWLDWNVGVSTSVTDYYTSVSTSTTRSYRAIITKGSACNLDTSSTLSVTLNPIGYSNQNTVAPVPTAASVCAGSGVTLTVSGFTGSSVLRWVYRDNLTGAWNVINSGSTSISDYNTNVSSTTIRSYRAIINNNAGCSTDTTGAASVTLSPITNGTNATAAQTSQPTFCSGNAVNVFISTPSGYNITSWLYSDNAGAWNVLSTTSSASVFDYNTTVSSVVTRSYRAMLRNTGGCNLDSSAIVTVTINSIGAGNNNTLVPTTSTPSVCSGNPAQVSLTGFSGNVIKWLYRDSIINSWITYNSTSTVFTDYNTSVSYNRIRTYRLIVYNPANCSYDTTASVQVNLNQLLAGNANTITPTSANTAYCSATPISVSATGFINGGTVTGWIFKDNAGAWTLISGSANSTYNHTATTVTGTTTRSYRALVLTGCTTDTTAALTVTLDVYPAKPVITKVTGTDSLVSSVSGTTYTWKVNGTAISANTQKITGPSSGSYTVEVGNASGCKTLSDAFSFIKTGLTETSLHEFTSVYPNPTVSGIVNVSLSNVKAHTANIKVYDMLGKLITETIAELNNGAANIELDISESNTGIYFVTIVAGEESITRKVIFNKQ